MNDNTINDAKITLALQLVQAGIYTITDDGEIFKQRYFTRDANSNTRTVEYTQPRKATWIDSKGYQRLSFAQDGKHYTLLAHRVVYAYFFGTIPDGHTINHENGIKHDNRPGNLKPMTIAENIQHGFQTGLMKPPAGEQHYAMRISDQAVSDIRCRYAQGESTKTLADEYHITTSYIGRIVKGKDRKQAPGPITNHKTHAVTTHYVFTKEQARAIRQRFKDGSGTIAGMAREYHVTQRTIRKIVHTISYKDN